MWTDSSCNFGLRLPGPYESERLSKVLDLYERLCGLYETLLSTPTGSMISRKFAEYYPAAQITDLKKIDLVLWQIR